MAAPFYLVFIPLAAAVFLVLGIFFICVSRDKDTQFGDGKSDLEVAQEMERQEQMAGQRL